MPSLEADIVLSTHDHEDHNNIKGIKGSAFLITGPGEYEVKGVSVQGISSFHDNVEGKERGKNTIYTIEAEGIRVCHLGDLGQVELSSEQIDQIGNIDVLLVPVGGVYTIDAKGAAKIVSQIEPRMVVPMHYFLPNLRFKLEKVDAFLREMGVKSAESQAKLTLKLKDLTSEETKVILLTP
jgi:L-ascorbate metabolism protein UlaG (beta-lactamase superfamily)